MIAIEMKKRNSRSAAPRSPRYGNKAMVMDSTNADMADGPAHRPMIKSCRDHLGRCSTLGYSLCVPGGRAERVHC